MKPARVRKPGRAAHWEGSKKPSIAGRLERRLERKPKSGLETKRRRETREKLKGERAWMGARSPQSPGG
jgi:hypothetical protein